jgi:hypothetical protein
MNRNLQDWLDEERLIGGSEDGFAPPHELSRSAA